jgi:hypothetical protein
MLIMVASPQHVHIPKDFGVNSRGNGQVLRKGVDEANSFFRMADDWRPLFEHASLRQREIDNRRISTSWAVRPTEFINSLPQDLPIPPATYSKIFRNVNVLWRGHHDGHCKLELRRDGSVPRKIKFILPLTEQFMNGVDLRVSKRVADSPIVYLPSAQTRMLKQGSPVVGLSEERIENGDGEKGEIVCLLI